eukprot:CAMPEP_0195099108 /NCGR_PEP_ID=MMETSP0448-20130528/58079_1 /TAXON_ID=66468 /ORGANISM="Heterocapsa triquestra, Strain CCMP 448" /LENGTH=361 /DNA_ID=CAMNT_0040133937 /DNA_START=70 /DNA_END=1155 /DNA_ORIENTATION=-
MAPILAEGVLAVKNTFLHFDESPSETPQARRRGSRAKTEPAAEHFEDSDTEENDSTECGNEDANSEQSNLIIPCLSNQVISPAYAAEQHSISKQVPVIGQTSPLRMPMRTPAPAPAPTTQPHLPLQQANGAKHVQVAEEATPVIQRPTQGWPRAPLAAGPVAGSVVGMTSPLPAHPAAAQRPAGGVMKNAQAAEAPAPQPQLVGVSRTLSGPVRPGTLEVSEHNDAMVVRWAVDAKRLRGSDKGLVSPPFELPFSTPAPFKVMLSPKGGMSFGKAAGKGSIVLKCGIAMENSVDSTRLVKFSLISGKSMDGTLNCARGPIRHNFAENGVCNLPKSQQEWDFGKAVNDSSQSVIVCIEILSC